MNIKKSKNAVVSVCLIIFIENKKDATTTGTLEGGVEHVTSLFNPNRIEELYER